MYNKKKDNLEVKDKLDALKHISQIHRMQLDERRKYEWKIFLASISLYVLSVAAVYKGNVTIPINCIFISSIFIAFFFQAIITILFLAYVYGANKKNKTIAENAEMALADLIGKEGAFIFSNQDCGKKSDWLIPFYQAIMIIIFAFIAYLLINLKSSHCGLISYLAN